MNTTNMGAMFAEAEAEGFSGKTLSNGSYEARVKSFKVKPAKGGERLLLTMEALSGAGTILHGQNFTPENEGSRFYWFRFLADFGIGKEFFLQYPSVTVEQIGQTIVAQAGQGATYRIVVQPQKDRPEFSEVKVYAPTGEADTIAPVGPSAGVSMPVVPATAAAPPAPAAATLPAPAAVQTPDPAPTTPPVAESEAAVSPAPAPAVPAAGPEGEKMPWEL